MTTSITPNSSSRLPSSLSQFEEAVGHRRRARCGDSETLVDGFQDVAAVEAPGEWAFIRSISSRR
jgi:hypothetical protein